MIGGYAGKMLLVDLTHNRVTIEPANEGFARTYVGGSGYACRLALDHLSSTTDPLGPENVLIFAAGPLVGTSAPSSGRHVVCARSPLTRVWGESHSGGVFGAKMKFAGFDVVVVKGRAAEPTYLSAREGKGELRRAKQLWGEDTASTQKLIKEELHDRAASVSCIGKAGENLVKYAAVVNDWNRAAGRTGMGAVMGSKNLKAVAVSGSSEVPVEAPGEFEKACANASRFLMESSGSEAFRVAGTACGATYLNEIGNMPNRYFSRGTFEDSYKIDGVSMKQTILTGTSACYGCPIRCGRVITINEGKYAVGKTDGPEYETLCGFGPNLSCSSLEGISLANELCNRYGIDTISCSVTIGLAYHLYEKGMLTKEDTGGLALEWGEIDPAIELVKMIAERRGLGALLAEGTREVGKRFGVEDEAMNVKGLEFPFHDARAISGMAVSYATSPRGACHNFSAIYLVEIGQIVPELGIVSMDRLSNDGKAELAFNSENYRAVYHAMIMCQIANPPVQDVADMLAHCTGMKTAPQDLLKIGERIVMAKRVMNLHLGATAQDDRLPRYALEPLPDGPAAGNVPDLDRQLKEYYALRGWDLKTGHPSQEKLQALGIESLSTYLPSRS
ncbi:aldehyde ferredoxin oxidoreductase family protein [[Eubacterium] cellulosolvens]